LDNPVKFPKIPASADKFRTTGRLPSARLAKRYAPGTCAALALSLAFAQACSSNAPTDTGAATAGPGHAGTSTATGGGSGGSPGSSSGGGAGANSALGGSGGVVTAGTGGTSSGGASGSGGSTAGSSGASAGGASGSGGAAGCVTAGSELCDDFETGKLDSVRWKQSISNMTSIAVETGRAHSGQYAVHLKFVADMQNTVTIAEGVTFPATPNKFYSRMWTYFAPDIPKAPTGDFHTGFMMGGGNNDKGTTTLGMGMIGSDQQYLGYSIFFGDPKYEFGPWSKTRIVANQWLCIELFEDGSDPTTEVRRVWLNDTELTDIQSDSAKAGGTNNPNHLPPKFDKVTFGVTEYHPIPTLSDMWIDDVRVSSQKIGCAN
jgi:hypothetical protein